MSTFKLNSIRRTSAHAYEVVLANEGGERAFEMTVDGDPIAVVTWGRDFSAFVDMNTGPLGPLFEAVLRFHYATTLEINHA